MIAGSTAQAPFDVGGTISAFEASPRGERSLSISRRNVHNTGELEGSPWRNESQRGLEPAVGVSGRNSEILRQNCARSSNKLIHTVRKYDDRTVNYKKAKEGLRTISNDYVTQRRINEAEAARSKFMLRDSFTTIVSKEYP